jgi:glutamyl-tRNA synthetase
MSKRETADLMKDHHSIFINDLQELGYIPEAVVNWIALMGWSYDDHTEFFSMPELIEKFSIDRLNPAPAAINFTKFDYFNGLHIRRLDAPDLARRIKPFFVKAGLAPDDETLLKIIPIIRERMVSLEDAPVIAGFFFRGEVHPKPEELIGAKMTIAESATAVRRAYSLLTALPDICIETAEPPLRNLADELGLKVGQLLGILRAAVTGQTVSPPLFESMEIIGRAIVLQRIENACLILENM